MITPSAAINNYRKIAFATTEMSVIISVLTRFIEAGFAPINTSITARNILQISENNNENTPTEMIRGRVACIYI